MSADFSSLGSILRTCIRQWTSQRTRRLVAGALAGLSFCDSALCQTSHQDFSSGNVTQTNGSLSVPMHSAQYRLEQPGVTGQVDAVHSPNVRELLKPQYKLELERRHSQLVITNRNIRRIAVTDSTIVNYVQYTPTELSVVGLDLGKTDLTLWFEGEAAPAIYEITVVRDESLEEQRTIDFGRLERRLTALFPNSRVYLIPIGNQVIVRGQAYDAEESQHILQIVRAEVFRSMGRFGDLDDNGNFNVLTAGGGAGVNGLGNQFGNQGFRDIVVNDLQIPGEYNVKMRVIVAEVNRSELRNQGLDWSVLFNNARHSVSGALGGTPSVLSGVFENGEIGVFMNWLTSNGSVTLLAEPVLVTMSGHSASILGGGEYAVPTIIGLGGGQATTFRGFGTSMVVTPTVIDRDLIRLMVVPEFSSLNTDNTVNGIPGTNVKRVSTTVELREGQTLAIGGLISRQTSSNVRRIPLLGDIPYVGSRLFHAKNATEVETELLVLVSPEIVRPMEPDEVPPLPNYYVTHPNDYDLYKYGRTEGNPDTTVYQVPPFGTGATHGIPQGYSLFNPPVTHGGFGQGMGGQTGIQNFGTTGGMHSSAQPLVPQPDHTLAPSGPGYSSGPGYNGQMAPGQGYQSYQGGTIQQFPSAPTQPDQSAPGMMPVNPAPQSIPASPLPPVPPSYQGNSYPAQGSLAPAKEAEKTTVRARMASMFRKSESGNGKPDQPAGNVRSAGWSKK